MNTQSSSTMAIETIESQEKYVRSQKEKGNGLGVVFADAFLRGMRDLGYRDPSWALAELVDNSVQAAADTVSFRFRFEAKSKTKPTMLAICDNGNGMIPDMIGYAVRWGGTDREDSRRGFGRYGYGLPSAAVSLAKRYTVYSKARQRPWHKVTIDIDELGNAAHDLKKTESLLTAVETTLPEWLLVAPGADEIDLSALESGTVVVLEELDRLNRLPGWIKTETLRSKLKERFGVIYRYWIPDHKIYIDGARVQVLDPLFLMEHGRFFDETALRAERVETRTFTMESHGRTGTVTIRAALLPPNFQLAVPDDYRPDARGLEQNKRSDIMREYNGLLICREKRQIDTISPRGTKFQNYDANVKIEIDFDPELDEFFGVTTAKQQIVIEDSMWQKLLHSGKDGGNLGALITDMRRRFKKLQDELAAKYESRVKENDAPRPSVVAMEESEKFKGVSPEPSPEQREEGERNLEQEVSRRSAATGAPKEQVMEEVRAEAAKRRWEVVFETIPEGPFYQPRRLGEQKRLVINTEHPFFRKIFDVAPQARAALEVLLFVLAERELEVSTKDAQTFYQSERGKWSARLRHALDALISDDSLINRANAMAEEMYETVEAPASE